MLELTVRFITVGILLILSAISFLMFSAEYRIATLNFKTNVEAFDFWRQNAPPIFYSGRSASKLSQYCIVATQGDFLMFESEDFKKQARKNCGALTIVLERDRYALAEAALIKSGNLFHSNDSHGALSALQVSYHLSPRDQWLAAGRFRLFLFFGITKSEIFESDTRTLVSSRQGLDEFVKLYLLNPKLRDLLLSAADTFTTIDRLRFLRRIKELGH